MSVPDNTLYHLTQSSNFMKLRGRSFIFDYPEAGGHPDQNRGLEQGVVNPEELRDETLYVVVSHNHGDHFHSGVFSWAQQIQNITYVLSYDIPDPPENALIMRPGKSVETAGIKFEAYSSTDAGVACSIFYEGLHIYFSGDNAFWNWDGDLDDGIYIRTALEQINKERPIDIAFQVCDPRLDNKGDGGIHIFARHLTPRLLVPVHAFGRYEFNKTVQERLRANGFDRKFWCVGSRGDICLLDEF